MTTDRWISKDDLIDLRIFTTQAASVMRSRLMEHYPQWGLSWRTGVYTDREVMERLRRAVDHLEAVLDRANDPELSTASDMAELYKRAADVANQAFMAADPRRRNE